MAHQPQYDYTILGAEKSVRLRRDKSYRNLSIIDRQALRKAERGYGVICPMDRRGTQCAALAGHKAQNPLSEMLSCRLLSYIQGRLHAPVKIEQTLPWHAGVHMHERLGSWTPVPTRKAREA